MSKNYVNSDRFPSMFSYEKQIEYAFQGEEFEKGKRGVLQDFYPRITVDGDWRADYLASRGIIVGEN